MKQKTIEFKYNGAKYVVSFEKRTQKTTNLVKRGILQNNKSRRKQQEMPDRLDCTHCTIIKNGKPVANGMAVCSPKDVFNPAIGRKTALQKTIQRARKQTTNLDKDWASEAWQHLFESETPNARACRIKAVIRSAKR